MGFLPWEASVALCAAPKAASKRAMATAACCLKSQPEPVLDVCANPFGPLERASRARASQFWEDVQGERAGERCDGEQRCQRRRIATALSPLAPAQKQRATGSITRCRHWRSSLVRNTSLLGLRSGRQRRCRRRRRRRRRLAGRAAHQNCADRARAGPLGHTACASVGKRFSRSTVRQLRTVMRVVNICGTPG